MKASDLPFGKFLPRDLRVRLAAVVSQIETDASRAGGVTAAATQLSTMLSAAATAVASLRDLVVPAVSTLTQTFTDPVIVLTYSKDLDPAFVPGVADLVISSPTRTVTGVSVAGRTVSVSYSGDLLLTADSPLIAYTQAAGTALRDFAGNKAADYTATAVTVASE